MPSPRPKRLLRRLATTAAVLFILGMAASWMIASALVAPCPCPIGEPPAELRAVAFTVESKSGDVICGWHTRPERSDGVVVLVHGIGGSRYAMLERARWLYEQGYAAVLIDLRAHGQSTGERITLGDLERHDVRAAVEFARREHPGERIGVVGASLGGAAALLASPLKIDALVVESVFPDITGAVHNRVADVCGGLSSLPEMILLGQLKLRLGISPADLRPIDQIAQAGCPVFVMSGAEDRHTTAAETQALFDQAEHPKEFWLVDGAAHVDLCRSCPTEYQERLQAFLDRCLRSNSAVDRSAAEATTAD